MFIEIIKKEIFMNTENRNVKFLNLRNTKNTKSYSVKIDKHDNAVTIYVFDLFNENKLIKVIRISKRYLLKEIINSL